MPARMRALYCTLAALGLAAAAAPAAQAAQLPIPIGPNYYFTAAVNPGITPGSSTVPVIKVICPGPITPGETGHPLAGQSVEAYAIFPPYPGDFAQLGFTGSAAHEIDVIFSSPVAAAANPPIVLKYFDLAYPIPTSLNLPCGGNGVASFVPIATSQTAKGVAVNVLFGNIAA